MKRLAVLKKNILLQILDSIDTILEKDEFTTQLWIDTDSAELFCCIKFAAARDKKPKELFDATGKRTHYSYQCGTYFADVLQARES